MKYFSLILGMILLVSQADSKKSLIAKENFLHNWKMPRDFTEKRIEKLLQDVVDTIYHKGFRYLGVDEDFFHGHLLFTMDKLTDEGRFFPFAILYHTQESAKHAHWGSKVDKKYDYLNVQTRNWIQWLDGRHDRQIENARYYADESEKNLSLFFDVHDPIEGESFTIHAHNLSDAKLGYTIVGALQFEFYKSDCSDHPGLYTRGPVRVTLADGEEVCLLLSTMGVFMDWDEWGF